MNGGPPKHIDAAPMGDPNATCGGVVAGVYIKRGAIMRFLLTRLVDWLNVPPGALVRPKDPLEYFRKLRFHAQATSIRDYGADA